MWRRAPRPDPGGAKAFVYAVAVHVTLLLLLGISLRFSAPPPREPPRVVQARVVDEAPTPAPEPPDTARMHDSRDGGGRAAPGAAAEEQARQAEAERARQAEVKRRQEMERQQQQAAERKKQAAEAEQAEKKRAAALEKKRAEEKRRREAEAALREQLAAEEKQQQEKRFQSEFGRYEELIKQKVQRSWNRPAGFKEGVTCLVRVRLVPGGEVIQATVIESCGNPVFDRSVENAVFKASPLPVPDDAALFERFFREFNFKFNPSG